MICRNCNTDNSDNATHCSLCGEPLNQSADSAPNNYSADNAQGGYQQNGYQAPFNYQQQTYQQPYQQAYPTYPATSKSLGLDDHVSVMGWIGRMLLTAVPIVGIVMLFIWAFGDNPKESLKTYARAVLILWAIGIVLTIIFAIIAAVTGFNALQSYAGSPNVQYYYYSN